MFEVCPKFGKVHPVIVKDSKAGNWKQKIMEPSCISPIREMMHGKCL